MLFIAKIVALLMSIKDLCDLPRCWQACVNVTRIVLLSRLNYNQDYKNYFSKSFKQRLAQRRSAKTLATLNCYPTGGWKRSLTYT